MFVFLTNSRIAGSWGIELTEKWLKMFRFQKLFHCPESLDADR